MEKQLLPDIGSTHESTEYNNLEVKSLEVVAIAVLEKVCLFHHFHIIQSIIPVLLTHFCQHWK